MSEQTWIGYKDLEPIRRLRNEGRELIGKTLTLTEKRDGENVSTRLVNASIPIGMVNLQISSHNQEEAAPDIINRFKATKEYNKVKTLLETELTFHHNYILYGELLKEVGPTRIEPRRKKLQWILFDAWDCELKRYISYTQLYQLAYHYKIPIVKAVDFFIPTSEEELASKIAALMKWCKRHRREGIVGKDYENQVFFKEKIDLPKLPKLPRDPQIQLPSMTQEKIIRALQHAYDEVGETNWKNVKVAMPIVAKHFSIEAKEHNFSTPKNMFQLWMNTPTEQIKPLPVESEKST
jgi:hypothetical protein